MEQETPKTKREMLLEEQAELRRTLAEATEAVNRLSGGKKWWQSSKKNKSEKADTEIKIEKPKIKNNEKKQPIFEIKNFPRKEPIRYTNQNGSEELHNTDGSITVKHPDGKMEYYDKDGKLTNRNFLDGHAEFYENGILVNKIDPNKTVKQEITAKTPEQEVADFISEFRLQELLPTSFANLDIAQQLKVIMDLKKRIVDIVKSDAQTQYSESLKGQSFVQPIKNSITKETDLKNTEKEVFEKLKN